MRNKKKNSKVESLKKELAELKDRNARLLDENKDTREILDSTLHEVRRFSAQLSRFAERLSRETSDQTYLNQTATSIFFTAGMISSRLAYTDIELNPRALESQTAVRSGIFKKFDKARRILAEEARDRRVAVNLDGECFVEIDALPVFELLPFVLLENAIKYSPPSQAAVVKFEQTEDRTLVVTVASIGPSVSELELPDLFKKGVRGEQVQSMPGQGLGLFLAKRVCDFHDFKIRAEIARRNLYKINSIDYSEFKIILEYTMN